ncbi:MAG: tubulin-like doman-containing protein, partial [Candidatus Eremiobacterota bacterium]
MTPHLLVGVGGVGTAAVGAAAGVLSSRGRTHEAPPLICLCMDTDRTSFLGLENTPATSFHLSTSEVEKLLANPSEFPALRRHVPAGVRPLERREGSGGVRAVARLAFLMHLSSLEDWFRPTLDNLAQGAESLRLSVVASPGGATGGALLAEVGFLVRRLLERDHPGVALVTEALVASFGRPSRPELNANAFAAWMELNHWLAVDTTYTPGLAETSWETDRPPFDQVAVFSGRDAADPSDRDAVAAQITAYLGLSLWPAYGPLFAEVSRRLEAGYDQVDDYGNPAVYFSPGSSSLALPFDEIRSALAARILGKVVERWRDVLFRKPEQPDQSSAPIDFLHRAGMATHAIVQALSESSGGA